MEKTLDLLDLGSRKRTTETLAAAEWSKFQVLPSLGQQEVFHLTYKMWMLSEEENFKTDKLYFGVAIFEITNTKMNVKR